MKKIILIIMLCISVAGAVFAVNTLENNKEEPKERKAQKEQKEQKEASVEKTEEKNRNVILTESRSLEYEFLSYEMIEDTEIEKQDTYKADFFCQGIPDADYQEEVIDYEKARKECPELRDIWDNRKKYTVEEVKEIYEEHIGPYRSMEHPKTRYLFVKCRITNLRDKNVEEHLILEHGIVSGDGADYVYSDKEVYFDKPQYTEGEDRIHSFFLYNFKPRETLECTLGIEIKQKYGEDEEYYIGFAPLDWDKNTGRPDKEPRMVKVTGIGG